MSTPPGTDEPIIVLIPVFNDWTATGLLLGKLDAELARQDLPVHVLLVDDGSTEPPPAGFLQTPPAPDAIQPRPDHGIAQHEGTAPAAVQSPTTFRAITRVQILELRRNLGHQRAIAIGLSYIHANEPCQAVLIMDGDGEDDPQDVPKLIAAYRQQGGHKIIFARRVQRSESFVFRFFYSLYRLLYQAMTGQAINVGNFSILPFEAVDRLVAVTELWNHYASAIFKARLPCDSIPTARGKRLAGAPRMNFVSLVIHGLSAISAYGDVVGVRMLLAAIAVICAAMLGLSAVVAIRLLEPTFAFPIAGWATNAFGLLVVILMQAIMSSILFIFIILSNRQGAHFLPVRDYSYFVLRTRRIVCPK